MLDQNSQKNEMAISDENRIATGRKMGNEYSWMNPELSTKIKTYRAVRRPKTRWEDEISEFLMSEETETTTGNDMKNNNTWIKVAKNRERWKAMKNNYAETASDRSVDNVPRRENLPQDPIRLARHLNGVKLDEDQVANTTQRRKNRRYTKLCRNIIDEWIKKAKDQKLEEKGKHVRNCSSSSARPRTPVKKQCI